MRKEARKQAFFEFCYASRMHQLAYEARIKDGTHKPKDIAERLAIAMANADGYYPPAPKDPYAKDVERLKSAALAAERSG